jgi:hypothetical protein
MKALTVVADDHAGWGAPELDNAIELAHDPRACERGNSDQAEAFSG